MISSTVVGHVGSDAEVREAGSTKVMSFSLASNSKTKVNGEWTETTTWVRISMFGDRVENLAKYVLKGGTVAVRGELSQRTYEKDGVQRTSLELKADDLQLLGGKDGAKAGTKSTKPETGFDVF
jgi:single-strand DNA-binding protein